MGRSIGAEQNVRHFRLGQQVHPRNAISPNIRHEQPASSTIQGEPRGYGAFFHVPQFDSRVVAQVAVLKLKRMYHFLACAAAKEPFAVAREFQAIKRLAYGSSRNDLSGPDIHYDDLMLAEASVQDGRETATRMHGDVDGEIAQIHLPADGPQRPLVG